VIGNPAAVITPLGNTDICLNRISDAAGDDWRTRAEVPVAEK
jgi:hypothetical protein